MLVDMGGGAYLRFAQSGAKLSDLVLIGISHLHPDHVSDLPALLWLSHLQRKEPLPIAGPSAGLGVSGPAGIDVAPDFATFLARMFDERNGAFQVMGRALGAAKGAGVPLKVSVVDVLKAEPSAVFEGEGLKVTAFGIPMRTCPPSRIVLKRVTGRSCSVPIRTAPIRNSWISLRMPMSSSCTSRSPPAPLRIRCMRRRRSWGASRRMRTSDDWSSVTSECTISMPPLPNSRRHIPVR